MNRALLEAEIRKFAEMGYTRDDRKELADRLREKFQIDMNYLLQFYRLLSTHLPVGPSELKGHIYVIRFLDYYKIGRTKDVHGRVRFLARHLPDKSDCIFSLEVKDFVRAERYLHKRFHERRTNKEWFRLEQHDVNYILSLKDGFYNHGKIPAV